MSEHGGVAPELEDEGIVVLNDTGLGGLLNAAYPENRDRTESLVARLSQLAQEFEGRAIELVLRPEKVSRVDDEFTADEWPDSDDPPDPL